MQTLKSRSLSMRSRRRMAPAVCAATEALEMRRMLATIQVTTLVDKSNGTGAVSLREALATAKSNGAESDDITFADSLFGASLPQTITLGLGELVVDTNVSILGPGAEKLVIDANDASRVFNINSAAIEARLSGIGITGGQATVGAGIQNLGDLSLINCTLIKNNIDVDAEPGQGAGIFNSGTLTLTSCRLQENTISGPGFGGALNNAGTLNAVDCVFDDNNAGEEDGGGVFNDEGADATLTNCTFIRNFGDDGGGVNNVGTIRLVGCTLTENDAATGGGFNNFIEEAVATLINCTITNNTAAVGAGVGAEGDVTIINSTITRNEATTAGGGVLGEAVLKNSIVALNGAHDDLDLSGTFDGSSFNLIGSFDGASGINDGVNGNKGGTDAAVFDPQLGVLASNGGTTQTMAITSASPAFNAGSNANLPANTPSDQRGESRIGDGTVDIGAFEVQGDQPAGEQAAFNGPHNIAATGVTTLQAEDFDSGGDGVSWHDTDAGNQGNFYRDDVDPDIQPLVGDPTGGNFYIGRTKGTEWLEYTVDIASAGTYDLGFRTASDGAGGKFHLEVDGVDQTGLITISDTGDWHNWQTLSTTASLPAGVHVLRLFLDETGPSGSVGNFNYLTFARVEAIDTSTASHVRDGATSGINHGASETLEVKKSTTGFNREAFIKFDLSSVAAISNAKLRLFGALVNENAPSIELQVLSSSSDWIESEITFDNKPAATDVLATTTITGTTKKTYDIDLTSFLQSEKAAGHNTVTLVLRSNTTTTTLASFNSDEAASNRPQIIVTT